MEILQHRWQSNGDASVFKVKFPELEQPLSSMQWLMSAPRSAFESTDWVAFSAACGSWGFLQMGQSVLDNFWECVTTSPWHWVCDCTCPTLSSLGSALSPPSLTTSLLPNNAQCAQSLKAEDYGPQCPQLLLLSVVGKMPSGAASTALPVVL